MRIQIDASALGVTRCDAGGDEQIHGDAVGRDPLARLAADEVAVEVRGCERLLQQRSVAEPLRVDDQVAVLRLGRDRLIDLAGVHIDRLRAHEHQSVEVLLERHERIEQSAARADVELSRFGRHRD
ncbi:MAG: hypothetical protein ACLPUT_07220 [Solirubrobacteraceae bacterium]